MTYETEGCVKSVKISANSSEETELDFVPAGAYLLEENGQAYCMFKAVTSGGNEADNVVEAKLLRFDKAKAVSMQIKSESLRNALIAAKINHSKIRVEIDGSFFDKTHEDSNLTGSSQTEPNERPAATGQVRDGGKPIIVTVEFT